MDYALVLQAHGMAQRLVFWACLKDHFAQHQFGTLLDANERFTRIESATSKRHSTTSLLWFQDHAAASQEHDGTCQVVPLVGMQLHHRDILITDCILQRSVGGYEGNAAILQALSECSM